MGNGADFAGLLAHYMRRIAWSCTPGALGRRANLPKATIVNWLEGRVARPRHWQDLARAAAALDLSAAEVDALLRSAGHAPLAELLRQTAGVDRDLLTPWDQAPPPGRAAPLPQPVGPLVGREGELRAVVDLVGRFGQRLLTICGPGGVGKSRLLAAAVHALAPLFTRVIWLDVSGVGHAGLVPATIGAALGSPGGPALLALDGFEHLLAAAPALAGLLAERPELTILVSSRAPLRISLEQTLPLAPLAAPDLHQELSAQELLSYPAVELLARRLQTHQPGQGLTAEELSWAARICALLDGLPLAIELAAARARLIGLGELLARLEAPEGGALALLNSGSRDLPARQQSLRASLLWSYNLLNLEQRRLFERLGVFVGGFSIEAAEAVCGERGEVLDLIEALVAHGLLRHTTGRGPRRFFPLAGVGELMREQLESDGAMEAHRRHAAYFLGLVESGAGIDSEAGNLRAALEWLRASELPAAARLEAALAAHNPTPPVAPPEPLAALTLGLRQPVRAERVSGTAHY